MLGPVIVPGTLLSGNKDKEVVFLQNVLDKDVYLRTPWTKMFI